MKGNLEILEHLNKVLVNEVIAINQYFLHAKMYKNWGLIKLGDKEYKESIEEMIHADHLVERILFLEGRPKIFGIDKLHIGADVVGIIQRDLELEEKHAAPDLREGIAFAETIGDFITRDMFKTILHDEEDHIDWLETQLELIDRIGLENYQQSMM